MCISTSIALRTCSNKIPLKAGINLIGQMAFVQESSVLCERQLYWRAQNHDNTTGWKFLYNG